MYKHTFLLTWVRPFLSIFAVLLNRKEARFITKRQTIIQDKKWIPITDCALEQSQQKVAPLYTPLLYTFCKGTCSSKFMQPLSTCFSFSNLVYIRAMIGANKLAFANLGFFHDVR